MIAKPDLTPPPETSSGKKERIEKDFYPTPSWVTHVLKDNLGPWLKDKIILECCAGEGAISELLGNCITNDIADGSLFNLDASDPASWLIFPKCDYVVTNPPFTLAPDIIPLAFDHAKVGIIFLLRLSYLEPTGNRAKWLSDHADNLCKLIPVNPRPKFRADSKGSDPVTVAWFVWRKDWSWQGRGIEPPFVFFNRDESNNLVLTR